MQLVTLGGQTLAYYPNDALVPMAAFPAAARLVPYRGALETLGRIGPTPPDPTSDTRPYAAPLTIDLVAYAALRRYYVEIGGVSVAGARIATDAESQAKIGNAYALQQATGAATVQFKSQSGWITLTADQLKALAIAVGQHVQACYAVEADLDAGIAAGTVKTLDAIDAAFAPLA